MYIDYLLPPRPFPYLFSNFTRRDTAGEPLGVLLDVREHAREEPPEDRTLKERTNRKCHDSVFYKLVHRSTNTGLGSTTSAPRGGDIEDIEREVGAGR